MACTYGSDSTLDSEDVRILSPIAMAGNEERVKSRGVDFCGWDSSCMGVLPEPRWSFGILVVARILF